MTGPSGDPLAQIGRVMSIALLGLRTVIYPSADVKADKDWWSRRLGIEPYFDQPFYVGFNVGGYELGLLPDATVDEGALVYWGVEDVATAIQEALENGAVEHTPATDVGDGIVTATVRAPNSTILGFIYNPHFIPETRTTH